MVTGLYPIIHIHLYDFMTFVHLSREHEWDKHGTCAGSVAQLDGEHNYFNGAVQIRSNMDFYK